MFRAEGFELLGAASAMLVKRDLHFNKAVGAYDFILSSFLPDTRTKILNMLA